MTDTATPDSLYEQILTEAGDAIIYADREGIIRFWNRGAQRIFGYSADEALGRSLDLIIPERWRERHWQGYRRVMASGVTKYGQQLLATPGLDKDGRLLSVEFSIVLVKDGQGGVAGAAAILRDVTARWQKEKGLKEKASPS